MPQNTLKDMKSRVEKSLEFLKTTYSGVRTGRAHPALVENITVDYFGSAMPIKQLGSVNIPEPRQIVISVWDKTALKAVEKAIQSSSLGINPQIDGDVIRLNIPELTRERRNDLKKLVNKYAEEGRVAVRNIRREFVDIFKKMEKDSKISEDDLKKYQKDVQDITDGAIKSIDATLSDKEKEIMDE